MAGRVHGPFGDSTKEILADLGFRVDKEVGTGVRAPFGPDDDANYHVPDS